METSYVALSLRCIIISMSAQASWNCSGEKTHLTLSGSHSLPAGAVEPIWNT